LKFLPIKSLREQNAPIVQTIRSVSSHLDKFQLERNFQFTSFIDSFRSDHRFRLIDFQGNFFGSKRSLSIAQLPTLSSFICFNDGDGSNERAMNIRAWISGGGRAKESEKWNFVRR
jgi:hypothetical protein